MPRNNDDYQHLERPSTEIYSLRKSGQLERAYQLALKLLEGNPQSDELKKALSWVLIDYVKQNLDIDNQTKARQFYDKLTELTFDYTDDFVQTINNQIRFLRTRVDSCSAQTQEAEKLSKEGQHLKAIAIYSELGVKGLFNEIHHESYSWVLYRYLKSEVLNLSSYDVRSKLLFYLNLKNQRPSLIHSKMLTFALGYYKINSEFNFLNFFKMWDPSKFQSEDLMATMYEGKLVSSLLSKICKEFVNTDVTFDIDEVMISKIITNPVSVSFSLSTTEELPL